jgi:glycosyltransferase involved in cell wall biosynthesis
MTQATAPQRAAILIPAFNEAPALGKVIGDIRRHCELPIYVIDDASTDDTAEVAGAAGADVLRLAAQLGAWGAIQTGLRYVLHRGFDIAITMDADGQHEARYIADLLRPVSAGECDVTIGAATERGSRARKLAWLLLKKSSGLSMADVTSGFRAYNREAITVLAHWRATLLDYQDIGVLLLLQSQGIRISDIPVSMRPRADGPSRVFHSWFTVAYYMLSTLLLGVTKRQAGRPRPTVAAPSGEQTW